MAGEMVGIVMGSDSDLEVMKEAAITLEEFGVPYEMSILSAHRTPDKAAKYGREASSRGLEVLIAGAGGAAHLAGVLAAHTTLPVIGVPLSSSPLRGEDALYSLVQMPAGVPVACVAIDGARNAAILAVQVLAVKFPELRRKLDDYRRRMASAVEARSARLAEVGYESYLYELERQRGKK